MKNVVSFRIEWQLYKLQQHTKRYVVPFYVVGQTQNKKIETYLLEKHKNLLHEHAYSMEEMGQFFEMKRYIEKHLTPADMNDIYSHIENKGFFVPLRQTDKVIEIKITETDAKFWNDPDFPHLQITGEMTIDIPKIVDIYIDKNFIVLTKNKSKLFSEYFVLEQIRKFPLILEYKNNNEIKIMLRQRILHHMNDQTSKLYKSVNNFYKHPNLHYFKKKIEVETNNSYRITFTNMRDIFQLRSMNRKLLGAAAGAYVLSALHNTRKRKQIAQLTNIKSNLLRIKHLQK